MDIETALDMKLKDISKCLCERQADLNKTSVTMEMKGTNLLNGKRVCLSVSLKEIEK